MYETLNVSFEISNFQLLTYQLSSTYVTVFSLRSMSFPWTLVKYPYVKQTAVYLTQADKYYCGC